MNKLSGNYLKILKTFHVGFIAVTFGGIIALEVILFLKLSNQSMTFTNDLDYIIYKLNNGIIYYSFLGIVATTIIYGLFTSWGLLRFYWIIIKWILLFVFVILFIIFFSPSINALTSLSDSGMQLGTGRKEYINLLNNSFQLNLMLILILTTIFFISTIKPFGKRKSDLLSDNRIARISILCLVIISVASGVFGSINLNRLRNMKIQNPDIKNYADGIYKGEFIGGGGTFSADVEINNHKIKNIQINATRDSKYVRFAEPVIQRIIKAQDVNVDAITGATTTSKCIMKSVENAFKEANK